MKRIVYTWLLLMVGLFSYGQQDQNLTITDARILPRPTTVGGTVNASFLFYAENGATLIEQSGEVIRYVVCFNRITAASIENAEVVTEYELSEGGTNNFVEWTYNAFSNCWIGITNRSLANASGFRVTFKNLTVARSATPADANNSVGIGFAVNLTPHSRDPSSGDDDDFTDNYTYTVDNSANLAISKVVNNATPTVGQNVTFTITATNNGPSNATGVVVNEPLPNGYTLVSTTPSTGTYTAPNWTIGNLTNGASATMTVVATVNATGTYANTVTVDGNEPDPDPTDNTDTETPTPTSSANLAITKVVNNATPTVGQNVTFTVTATNNGPSNATGVVVNEPLPSGYTLVSATPSTGTYTAPNWTIGNLANGASATMTVTATVNATGTYANTVTVTGNEPDPDPTDNTDTETPTPTPAPAPAIALVKTGILSTDGNTITYTFTVRNTGNVILNPVVVNDPKLTPSNVTLLATSLVPGAETTGTATYTVTPAEKAAGQVQNTATATGTPPTGNPVTDVSGTEFTNNTPTVVPVPTADLSITKTASNLTPAIGSQVTFTITATNNGPSNATGVVVNEPLPSGYTLVSTTPSTGTYTAPNWTIGNLANGASATMAVVATVNATGSYANTVTVDGNEPDPDPTDNTDTETPTPTPAPAPAIALIKTGVLSTDGNTITYTFTVRNTGNVILNPVVVNDPKLTPSNVTLLATSLVPGAETTGTATYTVTAGEKAAGQVQNTATATGTPPTGNPVTDVSGTEFTNNTPTVVPVPTADLSITKTASNLTPAIGSQITFTIVATNNGPSNATGVVVNEPLPSGYTLVSTTPSTGTYTAPNWTIGNLANGASATMTVTATVNATGSYANTVTVTGNEPDPDPTDNTDTETPTPTPAPAPAIALVKTGILSTDGNTITYTFTVRNTGNVILNPVVVNDPKLTPSNVTLLATSLVPGAETTGTATYTVTAAEKAAGQVQNTATATGTPPTGNPVTDVSGTEFTNNTPTVVPVPKADLSITKTASNLTPAIGSQVAFTITATNNGPSNATGVVVNEPLPSGYTLVSTTPSTGTYSAPNWTIGNLANGASATMTVTATVNATGSYANTVTIDGNEPDPDPTDNTDTETPTPKKCPDGVNCLTVKVTRNK